MSTERYDLPQEGRPAERPAEVRLLYAAVSHYSPEWNSVLHTHHCAELFFVTGGEGTLKLASGQRSLRTGDLVLLDANVEHTELSGAENPMEYIVLGVEGLRLQAGEAGAGCAVVPAGAAGDRLLGLLNWLLRELQDKQPGYERVCRNLLELLLIQLDRLGGGISPLAAGGRRASRECAIVHRYIDEHFKEKLSLDDLAELAHVSKYYLSHAFTREYGVSPISYLLERRIRESLYLLSETRLTLAEISGVLGFSSPSYFSQSFRRSRGTTPMAYRAACRRERPGEETEREEGEDVL